MTAERRLTRHRLAPSVKGIRAMSMAPAATLVRRFVPSQSPTEETFRQGAHLATLDKLVRLRLYVAPVIGGLALTFAFFEPTPWRRWTIVAVVSWLLGLSVVEWWRSRRLGLAAVNLAFNYYALLAGQLALVIATGGLLSPLSPVMIVMSIMGGLLIPQATIHVLPLLMVPLVWVLAFVHVHHGLVPAVFGDGRTLETGALPWLAATVLTLMVTGATRAGAAVSDALERLFSEAVAERDRRLDGYAEQTSALSALSAEIAHELKNPLASVKGLGALVAKDVEGKPAERMLRACRCTTVEAACGLLAWRHLPRYRSWHGGSLRFAAHRRCNASAQRHRASDRQRPAHTRRLRPRGGRPLRARPYPLALRTLQPAAQRSDGSKA